MGSVLQATERSNTPSVSPKNSGEAVPTIVPVTRQHRPFWADGSQVARSAKCLKRLDLLGKSKVVERRQSD